MRENHEPLKVTRAEWMEICSHPSVARRWSLDSTPDRPEGFIYAVKFNFAGAGGGYPGDVYILTGAGLTNPLVLARTEGGSLRDIFALLDDAGGHGAPPECCDPLDARTTPLNLTGGDWDRLADSAELRSIWDLDERGAADYLKERTHAAKFNLHGERARGEEYFYVIVPAWPWSPAVVIPDGRSKLTVTTRAPESPAAGAQSQR
jgi:hypothetical protein